MRSTAFYVDKVDNFGLFGDAAYFLFEVYDNLHCWAGVPFIDQMFFNYLLRSYFYM